MYALAFSAIILFQFKAVCQTVQHSGWLASFNSVKLNNKWSLHLEFQLRSADGWNQVQTILPRIGINYHVRNNHVLTAGYAPVFNRVNAYDKSALLAEHRLWQQYIINQKASIVTITHRFRLEERFVPVPEADGADLVVYDRKYSTRLRYFARAIIPFKKQQPFTEGAFAALQEEIFFNLTNQNNVNGKWFDQNRLYAAIGYRFSKKFDAEFGYMNQYVDRSATQQNQVNHIIQLAFYTRL